MFVGGGGSRENWRGRVDGYCVVEGTRLWPRVGGGGVYGDSDGIHKNTVP